ncbi:MAG TPA: NAD(P)-dependent alcohol dehydrogenase [Chitinophagaceae bacterium]
MSETKESPVESINSTRISSKAYAAQAASEELKPFSFTRRTPRPHDVLVDILYCGVCHSDLHFIRNDWGMSLYPLVPGHEIVGRVKEVGNHVKKYKAGDLVGIGCMVDSCRECDNCKSDLEQYCTNMPTFTYSMPERHGDGITYGGYSNMITCDEDFVLKVSDKLPLEKVAPLLCAGITTYSPLRHWKVEAGHKVGVVGLGGLGHMAIKFAASFGADVTVFSTSSFKEADARKLGAHHFVNTTDPAQLQGIGNYDFILDTVSAPHDYNLYLAMLKTDGAMACVGLPPAPAQIPIFTLAFQRRSLSASAIGGIKETQEMLDYCAENNITADVEVINIKDINKAFERMEKSDVKYRFVIDMATL